MLKQEILEKHPDLDIVIRSTDLSVPENAHQLYEDLRGYEIETWINNAGFGNYDSVADQDLNKISMMLNLNIAALTILSSLYVRDYKDAAGTQLINISSCGGLHHCSHGSDILCGEVLCKYIYGRAGKGTGRNRCKDEGKSAGTCGDKDRIRNGGKQCQ